MATSNDNVLLAALLSLPERVGEVAAGAFFDPLQLLLGGLLGKGEAGQLALHTQPSQQY
jgi:hypothetical protein